MSTSMLPWLLALALKSSLACGAALLACALLRRAAPALRHAVLLAGLASLVLLPVLTATLPSFGLHLPWLPGAGALQVALPDPAVGLPAEPSASGAAVAVDLLPSTDPPSPASGPSVAATPPAHGRGSASDAASLLACLAWAAGAVALSSRSLAARPTIRRLLGDGEPLRGRMLEEARLTGGARTRFVQSDACAMPVTFGIAHPVVMLPSRLAGAPVEELRMVLAHEAAHVARRDVLTGQLAYLACCLAWFVPLGWIALARLKVEQEKACDELAARTAPSAASYAELLLRLRAHAGGRGIPPLLAARAGGRGALEERIRSILASEGRGRRVGRKAISFVAVAAAVIIGCLAMTRCTAATPKPDAAGLGPAARGSTLGRVFIFASMSGPWVAAGQEASRFDWPIVSGPGADKSAAVRAFGLFVESMGYVGRIPVGVDIGAAAGTPVVAPTSGLVRTVGWAPDLGYYLGYATPDGYDVLLASLAERPALRPGEAVSTGQLVGHVGEAKDFPSPHLQYRVYRGGRPVADVANPVPAPSQRPPTPGAGTVMLTMNDGRRLVLPSAAWLDTVPTRWPLLGPTAARIGSVTQGQGFVVDPFSGVLAYHSGIDIAAPEGTPVVATGAGHVAEVGSDAAEGVYVSIAYDQMIEIGQTSVGDVAIMHGQNFITRYTHLAKADVRFWDAVAPGQVIGTVGSTGRSTGPHLHYEMIFAYESIDPLAVIDARVKGMR